MPETVSQVSVPTSFFFENVDFGLLFNNLPEQRNMLGVHEIPLHVSFSSVDVYSADAEIFLVATCPAPCNFQIDLRYCDAFDVLSQEGQDIVI